MSAGAGVGIPLALLTTTAYNLGLVLEKRALGRLPALELRKPARLAGVLLRSPAWLAGFGLMLTGLGCQVLVLMIEPVSVAQPILASGIALTVIMSRLILRERLGGGQYWCIAAMGVAVVLLALSSSSGAAGHHTNAGAMAAVIVPTAVLGLVTAGTSLRARAHKHRAPATGVAYGVGTGLLYGVAGLATKGLSAVLVAHHHSATGLAVSLIESPYGYVLAGSSAVAMVLYQVALQACRASILIPVSSVTSSVYVVVAGTWLFHERLPTSPGELALRMGGIAMAGVVLVALTWQAPAQEQAPRRRPAPTPAGLPTRPSQAGGKRSALARG